MATKKVATKGTAKSDTLTPAEEARTKAAQYAELIAQKKELEAKMEALKEELIAYSQTNADYDLGVLTVIPGVGKPKFDFGTLTKKGQEQLLARLKNDLPDFVISKSDLDVEALYHAKDSNPAVSNALKANGISIKPTESWTIRQVK